MQQRKVSYAAAAGALVGGLLALDGPPSPLPPAGSFFQDPRNFSNHGRSARGPPVGIAQMEQGGLFFAGIYYNKNCSVL